MDELIVADPEVTAPHSSSPPPDGCPSSCFEHDDEWIPLDALKTHAEKFGEMVVQSARMRQLVTTINLVAPSRGRY